MKDLHSKLFLVQAIAAAVHTADNTPANIDLAKHKSAEIALSIGVGGITFTGSNKIEFVLTHSDDGTNFDAVTADDVLGVTPATGGIIKALTTAHAAAAVYRYGYVGGRRYLKLLADFSGTHGAGTPIAAMVILSDGELNPQADQA
jgi:hypothetical protein